MSLLQRLANVGLGRRDEANRAADRGSRLRSRDGAAAAAAGTQATAQRRGADGGPMSRCRNMPSGPRLKDLIPMDARRLWHQRHRATTISISRRSCAARPTDLVTILTNEKAPAQAAGALVFATICIVL